MNRRGAVWVLLIAVAVAFACLAYPVYVIRPFRSQGAQELAAALWLMRWRVWIVIACCAVAIVATFTYWRVPATRLRRALVVTACAAVFVFAGACWINIFELMFHPDTKPSFSAASKMKLGKGEQVLAVKLGNAARSYPIRAISYHHIVNDTVGGKPIVATY